MGIKILFEVVDGDERELRFIDVENDNGESVSVGNWTEDNDGYRVLEIDPYEF